MKQNQEEVQVKQMNGLRKSGIWMSITPIFIWLLMAVINGFNFRHPWTSSYGMDLFLIIAGIVITIIGIILLVYNE